ncbi:hypothetical protein Pelo_17563 [Pelomyxa schiedti]|nr:hypothetical protein Pelo_17563 [Pelomyxa schiedti]
MQMDNGAAADKAAAAAADEERLFAEETTFVIAMLKVAEPLLTSFDPDWKEVTDYDEYDSDDFEGADYADVRTLEAFTDELIRKGLPLNPELFVHLPQGVPVDLENRPVDVLRHLWSSFPIDERHHLVEKVLRAGFQKWRDQKSPIPSDSAHPTTGTTTTTTTAAAAGTAHTEVHSLTAPISGTNSAEKLSCPATDAHQSLHGSENTDRERDKARGRDRGRDRDRDRERNRDGDRGRGNKEREREGERVKGKYQESVKQKQRQNRTKEWSDRKYRKDQLQHSNGHGKPSSTGKRPRSEMESQNCDEVALQPMKQVYVVRYRLRVKEQLLALATALHRRCGQNSPARILTGHALQYLSDIFAPHDRLAVCLVLDKPRSMVFTFGLYQRAMSMATGVVGNATTQPTSRVISVSPSFHIDCIKRHDYRNKSELHIVDIVTKEKKGAIEVRNTRAPTTANSKWWVVCDDSRLHVMNRLESSHRVSSFEFPAFMDNCCSVSFAQHDCDCDLLAVAIQRAPTEPLTLSLIDLNNPVSCESSSSSSSPSPSPSPSPPVAFVSQIHVALPSGHAYRGAVILPKETGGFTYIIHTGVSGASGTVHIMNETSEVVRKPMQGVMAISQLNQRNVVLARDAEYEIWDCENLKEPTRVVPYRPGTWLVVAEGGSLLHISRTSITVVDPDLDSVTPFYTDPKRDRDQGTIMQLSFPEACETTLRHVLTSHL